MDTPVFSPILVAQALSRLSMFRGPAKTLIDLMGEPSSFPDDDLDREERLAALLADAVRALGTQHARPPRRCTLVIWDTAERCTKDAIRDSLYCEHHKYNPDEKWPKWLW